jgi:hypothetical protein
MDPLLASVSDVRRRIGAHIAKVADDTINQLNFQHSLMAINIANCDTTTSKWLYFANRWVALTTSLVLLDNSEAFSGIHGGSISKTLGDFTLNKKASSITGTKFTDLIDRLECELFKIDDSVKNCTEPLSACSDKFQAPPINSNYMPTLPDIVTRGINEPNYPPIGRRWIRRDLPIATDKVSVFGKWYKTRLGY